jgi:putative endonuclease
VTFSFYAKILANLKGYREKPFALSLSKGFNERQYVKVYKKMFFVYILRCSDGSYYTGHTDDIEKRISEHKHGIFPCYTKKRLPIEVVHVETFGTRVDALSAERRIKGWKRVKKDALIRKDWERLVVLSNHNK